MILPVQDFIKTPIIIRQAAQNRAIPNRNPRLEATGLVRCRLCEKDANPIRIDEYNLHIFSEHQVFASILYYSFHAPLHTSQLKIEWQKKNNRSLNQLKRWFSSVKRPDCGRALDEIILEHEKELKAPFIKEKENQYAARSAFVRLLISEKFAIKEEIGDPPIVSGPLSERNARRTRLVEYYKKKAKEANAPIVIDSQDTVDDVVVVEDRIVQPKKRRKIETSSPVVILDDSDEEKTTEMDTQDDDIPITKLIQKGEKMVNKLETIKESLNEVQRPKIVLKDVNDNKDFFGIQRKPIVPEDTSSSSSSSEEEEEPAMQMPSVVKVDSLK